MSRFFRENTKLIVVAAVALLLGLTAPAIGHGVHAQFAHNADKVDGKHAVGAGTSVAKRRGKLVATNKGGRLPNNIITRAPNSARLGGYTHAQMSSMPLLVQGAGVTGSAALSTTGVTLPDASGQMRFGFVVPPDHKKGKGLRADIVYREHSLLGCSWHVTASGQVGPVDQNGKKVAHSGVWGFPGHQSGQGTIPVSGGGSNTYKVTFTWANADAPGMFVHFVLKRNGGHVEDTCGAVHVVGMQIRY